MNDSRDESTGLDDLVTCLLLAVVLGRFIGFIVWLTI